MLIHLRNVLRMRLLSMSISLRFVCLDYRRMGYTLKCLGHLIELYIHYGNNCEVREGHAVVMTGQLDVEARAVHVLCCRAVAGSYP